MKITSTIFAFLVTAITMQSFAAQIEVTKDLRGQARYYVRFDEISQEAANKVGVSQIPGTWDDEGYCQIYGHLDAPPLGYKRADLRAGDILIQVGEKQATRKAFRYSKNMLIEVTDVYSEMRRQSDNTRFLIGCSIDAGASETTAYRPVTDTTSKAYLTTLGLMVK